MPPARQSALNTILLVISIAGGLVTAIFFVAPLKTLPAEFGEVRRDVQSIEQTQAVQTAAMQDLAQVAKESRDTRREVDRNTTRIESIQRRLDQLERR